MRYFYSEIIEIESVITSLDELDLTGEQKTHLAHLLDSTVHHTVLDAAFSCLSPEDKLVFGEKVKSDPADKTLLAFLNERVDNIEEEMVKAVEQLKQELQKDIKEAKRIKKGG